MLTGYGPRAFCAGADIGRFPSMLGNAEAAAQYARDCSRLLVHIDRMSKPVVAALNGMALGGGLELALRCHGIVAQREAWLQLPEITLGIVPGIGAMVVPYRRWPASAKLFHDMMRRAERVSAGGAHERGIIDALSDSYLDLIEQAAARVRALSGRIRGPADGAVTIEPPAPMEPVAANGQRLSAEVLRMVNDGDRRRRCGTDLCCGARDRLPCIRRQRLHGRGARRHRCFPGAPRRGLRENRLVFADGGARRA